VHLPAHVSNVALVEEDTIFVRIHKTLCTTPAVAANVTKRLAEAYYTVEGGLVRLRDRDDKHLTSRALLKGDDPLAVARALLREAEEPKDFARPISYPKLGIV
jgi:hypothetical protein